MYRKIKKKEKLSRGTRERAESGRLLCPNQVKVTSSNTTDIIVVYFTNIIYLDAFLAVIFDSMDPTRDANANPNPSLL